MAELHITPEASVDNVQRILIGAVRKLREGMDEGPFGPPMPLTPEECCVLWQTLDILGPKLVEMSNGTS